MAMKVTGQGQSRSRLKKQVILKNTYKHVMHGIKLKSRTFAIDLNKEKCRSIVKVTLKLGQRLFQLYQLCNSHASKAIYKIRFCDILHEIMIAKDNSNISSPVGKKKYAYVSQRSRSKYAKKENQVILNPTQKHGLYGIELKRMTNAIEILDKECVFMHQAIARRSKGK